MGLLFFGTMDEAGTESKDQIGPMEQWKDFATSILLCLPHLVDQAKFEAELMRCCEYLVSGAEEEKKVAEKQRVIWLASEYLRFHARRLEFPDWPEWNSEVASEANASTLSVLLPRSASTQGFYNPIPIASPHIGMFSPRPEDANTLSLFDTLGGRDASTAPQSGPLTSYFDLTTTPEHNRLWRVQVPRLPTSKRLSIEVSRNSVLKLERK